MNSTASKAIFGIGVILAASGFISIYVASIALQNQNSQGTPGTSPSNTLTQTPSNSTAASTLSAAITSTISDSGKSAGNQTAQTSTGAISSINIAQGSAAQQVKIYYQRTPAKVASGSKVTWINNDIAPHTATASDNSFDTGIISVGSSGSALAKGQG